MQRKTTKRIMVTNNLSKLRGLAQELKLDAIILNNTFNIRYAAGYAADYCYLILTQESAYYLTDGRFTIEADNKLNKDFNIVEITRNNVFDKIIECLGNPVTVGYETSVLYCDCVELLNKLNKYNLQNATFDIESVRMIKNNEEIECISRANYIAEKSLFELKQYMKSGVTERELQMRLDFIMGMNGSEKVSFDTIVAFGENSAHAHAKPSERRLKSGDIMLFDYGATYNGYHSDMTRCFIFGEASKKQVNIYNAVLEAQIAALDSLKADKICAEIDAVARRVLDNAGYGKFFTHSLGHGVGLEIHESPSLNSTNFNALKDGMIVTVEPGVYIKGFGGIRIEDMAVVGGKIITEFPKELEIICDY